MPPSTSSGYEDEAVQHSLRDLLTIVFKRRWLIFVVLLTVVTAVMLVTLFMPRTYRVTSTFLVNQARAEMAIAPTAYVRISALDWLRTNPSRTGRTR